MIGMERDIRMKAKRQSVVVVEAVSYGRFYAKEAHRLGYTPVLVFPRLDINTHYADIRKNAERFAAPYAPIVLHETEDYAELLAALRPLKVAAVVAGSELGVPLADRLAESLGLPGNPSSTSAARRDKAHMQQTLADKRVRHIRGRKAVSVEQAMQIAQDMESWPVVLKPVAGSATVGVHFCHSPDELRACAEALFHSCDAFGFGNNEILVQEYIRGQEFVVNCVSCNGEHQLSDMWVYNKIPLGREGNPYDYAKLITRLEAGHAAIIDYAHEVLSALGFQYGPSHMEVMLDDRGPVLMEVGARPMGSNMTPDLLHEALGHHIVDRALSTYLRPDNFAKARMKHYRPKKSLMLKFLISPAKRPINIVPIRPLLERLDSVRMADFSHALEEQGTDRTVDLFSAPGLLILCHKREDVLMRDYGIIRWIENRYFTMLLDDESGFTPTVDRERMDLALSNLIEAQEYAKDSLVVLDAEADPSRLKGVLRLVTLAGVDDLAPDMRVNQIILHCGNRAFSFADYCSKLEKLVTRLNPGGTFVVTPWGMLATPYGAAGMEAVLLLLKLRLEVPMHLFPGVLLATKER